MHLFQVILYSAAQNSQQCIEQYTDKVWQLALSLWNSEQKELIQEIIKEKVNVTINFGKQISTTTLKYTNPQFLYVRLTELVGPECEYNTLLPTIK